MAYYFWLGYIMLFLALLCRTHGARKTGNVFLVCMFLVWSNTLL